MYCFTWGDTLSFTPEEVGDMESEWTSSKLLVVAEAKTCVWKVFKEAMEKDFWLATWKFWETIWWLRKGKQGLAQAVLSRGGELLAWTRDIGRRWKEHFEEFLNPTNTSSEVGAESEDYGLSSPCMTKVRAVYILGTKSSLFLVGVGLHPSCPLSLILFVTFMDMEAQSWVIKYLVREPQNCITALCRWHGFAGFFGPWHPAGIGAVCSWVWSLRPWHQPSQVSNMY